MTEQDPDRLAGNNSSIARQAKPKPLHAAERESMTMLRSCRPVAAGRLTR